jgi:hypothetical protein
MFQTVCLDLLRHLITAVRFIALQLLYCLLSRPLSSHAEQTFNVEEPFTFPMAIANVFWIRFVVMIVTQHTQVIRITSLRTFV